MSRYYDEPDEDDCLRSNGRGFVSRVVRGPVSVNPPHRYPEPCDLADRIADEAEDADLEFGS